LHLLSIVLIIAVSLAVAGIVSVRYRARLDKGVDVTGRRDLAGAISQEDGHVLISSVTEAAGKVREGGKQALALLKKQEQATALEHQVDDTISRLILMK